MTIVDGNHLSLHVNQWWVFVNTVMNFLTPQNAVDLLTS